MIAPANVTADAFASSNTLDETDSRDAWSGLISFLAAGAVLFASLVVGSSASLIVAGSNDLIAAILQGFLLLGLWALGAFLIAIVIVAAFNSLPRRN